MNQADLKECEEKREKIYNRLWFILIFILGTIGSGFITLNSNIEKSNEDLSKSIKNISEITHETKGKIELLVKMNSCQSIPSVNSDNPVANATKPNGKERL